MSIESTRKTLDTYLTTLAERGPYAQYFADEVYLAMVGTGQEIKGREAVEQFIRFFHEQAFDGRPEVKSTIYDDGRAAVEFDFLGTHTAEFLGVPAQGNQVKVPYAAVYDVEDDRITALRIYMPVDDLIRQISAVSAAVQLA